MDTSNKQLEDEAINQPTSVLHLPNGFMVLHDDKRKLRTIGETLTIFGVDNVVVFLKATNTIKDGDSRSLCF